MCKILTSDRIEEVVDKTYNLLKSDKDGKNADYIPYLASVPSSLFAISVCLPNGEIIERGDSDYIFGIESISKVPTALLAMVDNSANEVLNKIGSDATGLPFNSIMAILLEADHPSTPLVNSGAISACSMIKPIGNIADKWDAIVEFINKLTASKIEVLDELYQSESETNFNNRAIAWLLKNYNRIYDDPLLSLDLYTKQCSLGVSSRMLSIMAATISNQGVNPVSGESVFESSLSAKITSMISTVGFYEHTGDWLFESGIPAKSGVGGGVLGVMPHKFGIAAFAPPLDSAGNSIKAQKAIKMICSQLEQNIFG